MMFRRRPGGDGQRPAPQSTKAAERGGVVANGTAQWMASSSSVADHHHHRSNEGDVDGDGHAEEEDDGRVLWCGISRDAALLVQQGGGDHHTVVDPTFRFHLTEAAQQLLDKPATAGFEFHTYYQPPSSSHTRRDSAFSLPGRRLRRGHGSPPWRGVKFHVFDEALDDEGAAGGGVGTTTTWVYAAVYVPHPTHLTQRHMQALLEKLVILTEPLRCRDKSWRHGGTGAAQRSFGPILEQQIRDVGGRGSRGAATELLHTRLEAAQAQMHRNIEVLLDREERLQSLHDRAGELNEAACVFRKNTRRVRRLKMWQDAKHGILIGTAVTIGVAIVVVPPLIALL